MSEVSNIPRNPLMGMLADALSKVKGSASGLPPIMTPAGPIDVAQVAEFFLGKAPEVVDDASYGFSPTKGAGQATVVKPEALDLLNLLPIAGAANAGHKAAGKVANRALEPIVKALQESKLGQTLEASMEPLASAGKSHILRPGGDPRYGIAHTATDRILDLKELNSPSFAIQKDQLSPNFGDFALIPRAGAFDPALSPATLLNRDGYVPRNSFDYDRKVRAYGQYDPKKRAVARLGDRGMIDEAKVIDHYGTDSQGLIIGNDLAKPPVRIGEGGIQSAAEGGGLTPAHQGAIQESPAFPSFAEYERSPRGAKLLESPLSSMDMEGSVFGHSNNTNQLVSEFAKRAGNELWRPIANEEGKITWDLVKRAMQDLPEGETKKLGQHIVQRARQTPSEYAELKTHGPVPVTKERFAALLVPHSRLSGMEDSLRRYTERTGIPVRGYDPQSPLDMHGVAHQAQVDAGSYGSRVMPRNENVDLMPGIPEPRQPGAWSTASRGKVEYDPDQWAAGMQKSWMLEGEEIALAKKFKAINPELEDEDIVNLIAISKKKPELLDTKPPPDMSSLFDMKL